MTESESHKRAKRNAPGENEAQISRKRRVDSMSKTTATEIERSGSEDKLDKAVCRLRDSGTPEKVLVVPHKDIYKAVTAMKKRHVKGIVRNLSGTKTEKT